jgi:hypothetical protein
MKNPRTSKRFESTFITEKVVPVLLGLLVFILAAVIVILALSLLGVIHGA